MQKCTSLQTKPGLIQAGRPIPQTALFFLTWGRKEGGDGRGEGGDGRGEGGDGRGEGAVIGPRVSSSNMGNDGVVRTQC